MSVPTPARVSMRSADGAYACLSSVPDLFMTGETSVLTNIRRTVARFLVLPLVAGLTLGLPPAAVAAPPVVADRSVPVSPAVVKSDPLPRLREHVPGAVSWPSPGSVEVDISPAGARHAAVVGGLPVTVSAVMGDGLSGRGLAAEPAPSRLRIEVLDRAVAQRGGAPVAFKLSRADGRTGSAKVHVEVDFHKFRHAFGGAYASRVELRLLPECGLSAVSEDQARRGACAGVALESVNNFKAGKVSAVVDLGASLTGLVAAPMSPKQKALVGQESLFTSSAAPGGGSVVMMTAGGQGEGVGTFSKTNLKESGTWSHSGASGNFGHNYPLTVPPVAGSLAPKLSLDYSSASVDGQTAAEHIQNGPLGEGWSLAGGGFIESTFRPCSVDNSGDHPATWTNVTSDPCWRYENYQLSWAGRSGELVPTSTANTWRVASDDGAKVEFLAAEGFWRITTTDGTQWYFGRQRLPGWTSGARETGSVLTQEVFANHSGEPCFHASGYAYSHCTKPYRWLLDHVVDVNGNSMSYWYSRFTNLSGSNNSGQSVVTYHRDAVLDRIEYGTRVGNETTATPPAKVEFTNSDRCVAADCAPNANWPDTPWDLKCDVAPCNNNLSPSYWTTKRLTKVISKVWTGSGTTYKPVDEWSFTQLFPEGTDVPTLWLESITRKGYDASGASTTMPPLTTHGRIDRNRADYDPNASMADPQKYRIDYIDTETGGRIEVSYLPANEPACTWWSGKAPSEWPNYNHNASRCFQQFVTKRDGSDPAWTWWHKFVVDKVTEKDRVGGSPDKVTSYSYTMDGATSNHPLVLWGYSSSVWASPKKAMSSWKGYPTVITTIGAAGGTQSKTKRVYYRGLNRDTGLDLPGQEFFRTSNVVDSEGVSVLDHPALGGQVREVIVYDGATGPEISKTITTQSVIATTAGGTLPSWQTPPERYAYLTRETATKTWAKVADGTWRTTESLSGWDPTFGTLTQLNNIGQTFPALSSDNLCTRYTYARNTNDLTLRLGTGSGLVQATGNVVATDWSAYDHVFTPGDFTGDGKADVLALNRLNRGLYLFTGNGAGGFSAGPTYVAGFPDDTDQIFSGGDFSGDGKPDVIYRRSIDSHLYMISGNGVGGWVTGTSVQIGTGWGDAKVLASVGDFSGDGKTDVLFLHHNGTLLMYTGNGAGGWLGSSQIATGWTDKDKIFGKGSVTGDAKADLYARNTAGNLHLYPGTGSSLGTPTLVGSGWNAYQHLLTAGDVTADGKADIFAVYGGARLTAAVSRTETVGVSCGTTAAYPADLISDHRTFYDGNATIGAVPMKGLPTKAQEVKSHNGTSPTYITAGETGYDQWGRPLWTKDPLGNQTDTLYTHNSAGLPSSVKVTAPPAVTGATRHAITTSIDVLRGVPVSVTDANGKITSAAYDPLGRLKSVREPGNTGTHPDVEYTYSITGTAVPHLLTKNLGPNGNQIVSYEIFDGLLRPRQTQTTAPDGKRVVTDIRYDSRGLTAKASVFYNNASGPNSTLVWPTNGDADIDTQTRYVYDGAARQTFQQAYQRGTKLFETETRYGGDRTGVIPPTGGVVTQDLFDARGRITEKRQFSGTPFTGAFDKTTYTYDRAGRLLTVKDPATNTWTYEYDLLGRKTKTIDPDTGTSTATYNNASQVLSSTDGRSQTLFYEYDNLGRRTKQRADTVGGPVMVSWTFDTVAKGQLTSTSRFDGATTYTSAVGSYDNGYRPLSATETVPGFGTGGSALTYTSTFTYKTNGAPATTALPGVGGLPAETLSYSYTDQGLPKTLTSGQATYIADMTYTYDGMLAEQRLGAGGKQVKQTNVFDAGTRRLASADTLIESSPSVFTSKYTSEFGYNNAGLITSIAGKTNGSRDQVECFKYDYLQRLNEAWTNNTWDCNAAPVAGGAGADPYWRKWTFDLVGNRLTQTDKGATADTTWTYQVGAAGAVKPHQVKKVDATGPLAATATRTFSYDAAGNMLSRNTDTGVAQTLTWDKEGHLATLTEGSEVTSYVYDSAGRRLIAKNSAKQTLYLPDGTELEKIGSADPLGTRYYNGVAVRGANGLKWIASNHQQTSIVQIDSVTLSAERRRFLPYGELRGGQPSGWLGTKGYVGGTKDDTGLTHIGAREYDPSLGRFISRDPIMNLNSPQQIHGYSYGNNSPVTMSDPSGLGPICGNEPGGCNGPGNEDETESSHKEMEEYNKRNKGSCSGGDRQTGACNGTYGGGGGEPPPPPAAIIIDGVIIVAPTIEQLHAAIQTAADKWCDGECPETGWLVEPTIRDEVCTANPVWCEGYIPEGAVLVAGVANIGYQAFGTPGRPPHTAQVTIFDPNGKITFERTLNSGQMTPAQKAMGYPKGPLDSHTEVKATRLPQVPGGFMVIEGSYRPCNNCRHHMANTARQQNVTIVYTWQGRAWVAAPGSAGWRYARMIRGLK